MNRAVSETEDGVTLSLHVQPRASKNEIVGMQGDAIKVRLTSPPVDGAANQGCRSFLAKLFGIAKSDVVLIAGDKSRHKKVLLRDLDAAHVQKILERQ